MTTARALAAATASMLLAGCATLFTGTTDPLRFDANVPGVRLTIDGQYQGELPLSLTMSRNFMGGRQFVAKFEAPGHVTQEFILKREFNAVAILDISSPLTSGGVDVLTGALMKFSPLDYHVQMVPAGAAGSREQRRSLDGWRFALVNHHALLRDLARGGGESLDAFAAVLADGDGEAARAVAALALRAAPELLRAETPHVFVARLDAALEAEPALRDRRI